MRSLFQLHNGDPSLPLSPTPRAWPLLILTICSLLRSVLSASYSVQPQKHSTYGRVRDLWLPHTLSSASHAGRPPSLLWSPTRPIPTIVWRRSGGCTDLCGHVLPCHPIAQVPHDDGHCAVRSLSRLCSNGHDQLSCVPSLQLLLARCVQVACCSRLFRHCPPRRGFLSASHLLVYLPLSPLNLTLDGLSPPPRVHPRGFHCAPFWRDIYMLTISLFGAIGLALSWIPYFSLPHTRFLRTCTPPSSQLARLLHW